jgi:hypothetical protein
MVFGEPRRWIGIYASYCWGRIPALGKCNKTSSFAGVMASDAAIAASLALQHGCPVEVLRKALSRDARGNPLSPLGVALDKPVARP